MGKSESHANLLWKTASLVAEESRVELKKPWRALATLSNEDAIFVIANASSACVQAVELPRGWWTKELGPILGFLKSEVGILKPVALIPQGRKYQLYDVGSEQIVPVNTQLAEQLQPYGYIFFHSFPVKWKAIWSAILFWLKQSKPDWVLGLWVSFGIALVSILPPFLLMMLLDVVVPSAKPSYLWQLGMGFFLANGLAVVLDVVQGLLFRRVILRFQVDSQMALMDRVMQLPISFFRSYAPSDLAFRTMGISRLKEIASEEVIRAWFGGLFAWVGLVFVFWIHVRIGLFALAFAFLFCLSMVWTYGRVFILQKHALSKQMRALFGVEEALQAIHKVRVRMLEGRLLARWHKEQDQLFRDIQKLFGLESKLSSVSLLLDLMVSLVLFAGLVLTRQHHLSTGKMVAVYFVLLGFTWSLFRMMRSLLDLAGLFPLYQSVVPILEAKPEVDIKQADPGLLTGAIALQNVSFHYEGQSQMVLSNVSLEARPGEWIAIVGPSGCGKSTLLRVLLGLEKPKEGSVLYDNQDLGILNLALVRRQMGVVLQNGKLFAGTILDNIIGASLLSLEDAMWACKQSGFLDDLKTMPMGVHTLVGDGGGGLSMGQKQRLLLARALARKPKVLFLDEATSNLDNLAQEKVMQNIAALQVTRLVIAHRLSTIQQANRIYVMAHGRMVQTGHFDELSKQPGMLLDMVKRQI